MLYGELHRLTGLVVAPLLAMLAAVLVLSWCMHIRIERPLGRYLRSRLDGAPATGLVAVAKAP